RWILNGQGNRTCKHTEAGLRLLTPRTDSGVGVGGTRGAVTPAQLAAIDAAAAQAAVGHPLVDATRQQWGALAEATWGVEERDSVVGTDPYHFVLLRITTADGVDARAVAAFAGRHFHGIDP